MHLCVDMKVQILYALWGGERAMTLREIRTSHGLTQAQAAGLLEISLRSYKSYETDPKKTNTPKYRYLVAQLNDHTRLDESHGLLTIEEIARLCGEQLATYPITYAYLFGSYAKGTATETSDVDLLVSGEVSGLRFYGLVEALREALHKEVDVLTPAQLSNNPPLLNEILKDGIKIYG